jgi:hypothetical protein
LDARAFALPPVRGTLTADRPMAELTWLRVGGTADWLFQPADEADLADFLRIKGDRVVAGRPVPAGINTVRLRWRNRTPPGSSTPKRACTSPLPP